MAKQIKKGIFTGDIAEMKNYVVQYLVKSYNYDYDRAKDIVRKSSFSELIDEDTEYVLHYSVEYWGEDVRRCEKRT